MNQFYQSALFEHRFWLQVLGDHSRFIRDTLSPTEGEFVNKAVQFIQIFDSLLEKSRQSLSVEQLQRLTEEAYSEATSIREFKLDIIREHLVGDVTIELSPTFLNHMVNEVDEYLRILPYLLEQQEPPICHPLHHHLVWLLDAAGHAGGITDSLDLVEKQLQAKSEAFTERFEHYYIKAVEMAGYLRANVDQFPALERFNENVKLELILFKTFLNELEELEMTNKLLGTLDQLMADHMAREECYYLEKLAQSAQLETPDCDPTKPRSKN
ncbi:hypothetical protein JCM9140_3223 [Halalkalibacter wakoensis JCM 9140]|uniref:DUF2935 domain-containing protein n=1 Tax=Halalkalibacter wakoensis JCM 9140 TaxID=1236970 RepID=W4Q5X9_9BACI|nr:DUF2935 domain-containing protein [Halalkalibacter wakoensis]GAE27108.1 hypothetical protein JCM9140_3223 [Halalkalibacter wakoensis JCM 9140]